jgi:hypothetical protein
VGGGGGGRGTYSNKSKKVCVFYLFRFMIVEKGCDLEESATFV